MTECPSEDELVRLVEGALADASLGALEAHVDQCERCASVIASLAALGKPDASRRVGRYELDRRIATGGMGEVWAAWDPELRREIAIKLVRPERADDTKERARLLHEARALAHLTHPNVLAVHDIGEADGEVYLATELVGGDTLATRGGANVDWQILLRFYVQAARGLAAAHAAGLVHRDVKPANLLLGPDGRVRVADFGLAVRCESIPASHLVAGTPAYMAPEQRAGKPADARADQFALCVALAEAIAGRRPSIDLDRTALTAFVTERRNDDPGIDALCAVLARGLARDPAARFPDMTALADALDAILAQHRTEGAAVAERTELAPHRRRTIALATIAVGAGTAIVWFALRTDSVTSTAPAPHSLEAPAATPAIDRRPVVPTVSPPAVVATPASKPARVTSVPAAHARVATAGVPLGPPAATTLADVDAALVGRDRKACRAAIRALAKPPNDPAVAYADGVCAMLEGDCDRGTQTVGAVLAGKGMSKQAVAAIADQYCPPGSDPSVRLRRLLAQTNAISFECSNYIAPARAAAAAANTDVDRQAAGTVLLHIAKCSSARDRCDEARALLGEARALMTGPTSDDLAAGCR